jgi:formate/nitrite transporter FocA (FNT family)
MTEYRGDARDRPLEEAQKPHHTLLEQQLTQALEDLERPVPAILLSALAAGLDLGFGPFAMAVQTTLTKDVLIKPIQDLLNAALYPIGFLFVVIGRAELFTEQTTSAIQPVLARRASVAQLFRLWGLVLVANLIGSTLFALFATRLGPALGIIEPSTLGAMAMPLIDKSALVTFFSAVGAGWLMGLLAWLVIAARDTMSQLVIVWFTTFLLGLAKLHHSIAGSAEVLMSVFSGGGAGMGDFAHLLVWSVLGNAVGGCVFVGVLKYGAVQQG